MRVSNIILRVRDMDEALTFYRDQVGLPIVWAGEAFSFLDAGTVTLALNRSEEAPAGNDTEIVLEVEDVRSAFALLSERGVPFRVGLRPVMEREGVALLAADFRDPFGNLLSITGWE